MSSLVDHLHQFIKDVQLTQSEWENGHRLSDAYWTDLFRRKAGVHSIERHLRCINAGRRDRQQASQRRDREHRPRPVSRGRSPRRSIGDNISLDGRGESCLYVGRVLDLDGKPISGATIDVWSDNAEGFYDVQQPDVQPRWNNRGIFTTGPDGVYSFKGIKPVSYPIPNDGPVGQMLEMLGRHPFRPAHMHYIATAAGFQRIVTHTFVGDDDYLESDAVFGVKGSLIAPFERLGSDAETKWQSNFDFILTPSEHQ